MTDEAGKPDEVTDTPESWWASMGRWRLPARAAAVTCVFLIYLVLAAPVGWLLSGSQGLLTALLATGVCWIGALAALLGSLVLPGPANAMWAMLLGMGVRTGVPLLACLLVYQADGPLAAAGFAYYLLPAYLLGLFVETLLMTSQLTPPHGTKVI